MIMIMIMIMIVFRVEAEKSEVIRSSHGLIYARALAVDKLSRIIERIISVLESGSSCNIPGVIVSYEES